MRHLTLFLTAAVLVLPATASVAPEPAGMKPGEIRVFGALRAMFHEGQTGPMVSLEDLGDVPDLHAVGALSGLRGEVTILDGTVYLSYPETETTSRTTVDQIKEESATLLVAARVTEWRTVELRNDVALEDLDAVLAGLVGKEPAPFPFLIHGTLRKASWHIIDGRRLKEGGDSHEDHLLAAVVAQRDVTEATLIGFYSESHQGVFTHRGSRTHVHCIVEEPTGSGHLDAGTILKGAIVSIPVS